MASQISNHANILKRICRAVASDDSLLHTHVALVLALLYFQDIDEPLKAFSTSRARLMRHAHIKAVATYHKCLSDLVKAGYIDYTPSWHPKRASQFRFLLEKF